MTCGRRRCGSFPIISPLAGEMSPEVTEGGSAANSTVEECAAAPPSALPGISPAGGRSAGRTLKPPTERHCRSRRSTLGRGRSTAVRRRFRSCRRRIAA
ncbi:hypothetical protein F4V90_05230 [Neorhizobium galegae]|nr:hypothetical protein F4V90_05230 [Neorhizobium galegae]